MYYQQNSKGALVGDGPIKTLVITEDMLKEYEDENGPLFGVLAVLRKYFPEVIPDVFTVEEESLRKIARDIVVHSSARLSDPLFLTRVWFCTVETVLNRGQVTFRLFFPYMEETED